MFRFLLLKALKMGGNIFYFCINLYGDNSGNDYWLYLVLLYL